MLKSFLSIAYVNYFGDKIIFYKIYWVYCFKSKSLTLTTQRDNDAKILQLHFWFIT